MSNTKQIVLYKLLPKFPVVNKIILTPYRLMRVWSVHNKLLSSIVSWLFNSNELTNFTYDLSDSNKQYLSCFIAEITGINLDTISQYLQEIEQDIQLKQSIENTSQSSYLSFMTDKQARFGRRIGWYLLIRALKPKVVVETGIDKGLGSIVIASALMRNDDEGYSGHLYATDIDPNAGYLIKPPYNKFVTILYGDSIESLTSFENKIDIFINDSDHSADYEAKEYLAIQSKLSSNSFIIGDNADITTKLFEFSLSTNRKFLFFKEEPMDHWFPGGGIGISYKG
jgi:predicted O-methyltransferase YrrM